MQIRRYEDFSEIPLDASEWDQLVTANQTDSIFLHYHWIQIWWKYFGSQYKLWFLTAEENGQVLGFAPLMLDHRGCVRLIGDTNADYLDFVVPVQKDIILREFFELLFQYRSDWSSIELKNIPGSSALLDLMPAACSQTRLTFWKKYSIEAPSLAIKGNEKDIRKLLSRSSIRRTENRLRKCGDLEYRIIRNMDEAGSLWTSFFNQHIQRCESIKRNSTFLDRKHRRFIIELFNTDTTNCFTHFSAVLMNGKPIAFHFGFISQNRLLWYKPCFDISIKKGSPGILLIRHLAEYAMDNALDELDFTIGTEAYKDRFCTTKRQIDTVRIYRSRIRFFYDYTYDLLRSTAKNFHNQIRLILRLTSPG